MKIKFFTIMLLLPIIHVLANITTNYFPAGTINPGFFRVVFMALVVLIFLVKYKPSQSNITLLIYIFLAYNLFLVLMNQNVMRPLIVYIRMALPFFMLIVGYTIIKNYESLISLLKVYVLVLFMLCVNYALANYFGFGKSAYLEESFYIGGTGAGLSNEIAILVVCGIIFLMINNSKKWNYLTLALIAISIIIMLILLRRGAFITLGAGMIVLLYYSMHRFRFIKYFSIISILFFISLPYISDTFVERYEHRASKRAGGLVTTYQVEGRYQEIGRALNDLSDSAKKILVGTHNLNSVTYFDGRELHVGYMAILHGSGIIGLMLFLSIIFALLRKEIFYYKIIPKTSINKYLHILFLALVAGLFGYLITSRLHGFSTTTPVFLMLGAILGVFQSKFYEELSTNDP